MTGDSPIPAERIAARILVIRGQKVILDADLATLYGVPTKHLIQAVRRNADRFPADFAFELTDTEWRNLRSRIVISSWGGRRSLPRAFTEHGALMAAAVLSSPTAVQISLQVVRAFVRIRQLLAMNENLARRVAALERKAIAQETGLRALSDAFQRPPQSAPPRPKRRIGFEPDGQPPAPPDEEPTGAVPTRRGRQRGRPRP